MKTLTTLAAVIGMLASSGLARADKNKDPDADFDDEFEQHSAFWESVALPDKDLYNALVARAVRFIDRSDDQSRRETRRLLDQAIKLAPDQAVAWWHLASLHDRKGEWKECAAARTKVYKLDPEFKPPRYVRNESSLDYALGRCLAQSGNHEQALVHFKRLQAKGNAYYLTSQRMGESYMALGRLNEAIAAFRATERRRSWDAMVQYALAVAYDRDEQLAAARTHLSQALRRDSRLSRLNSSTATVSPASDLYYYRALARSGKKQPEWALLRFREFLHHAPTSPWRRRAEHHIKELARLPLSTRQLTLRGTTTLDRPKTAAAVTKLLPKLQTCVNKLPGVLFQVEIRALTPRRRRAKPELGITSRVEASIAGTSKVATAAAILCLDTAAHAIRLPRSKGSPGSYVRVAFPVIAQ